MRKSDMRNSVCWLVCCGLWAVGCGREAEAPPPETPLAQVGDVALTEQDFAFEVRRRQASGRATGDAATILQEMVERQAMLQRAAASAVADDPEVRREVENSLLAQWLQRELQTRKDRVTVSEADLQAVYEANAQEWTRPRQVRLAMLFRSRRARDDAQAVEKIKADLRRAVAAYRADSEAATNNGRMQGFGKLAIDHSEDTVSRYRGGDLGWLETGRTDARWPSEVVSAGCALEIGAVSEVIETANGFYVVMKTDERDAQVTPFAEAKLALRRRLLRERQDAVQRDFMRNVMSETRVEINRDKAARLTLPKVEESVRAPAFRPVNERMPAR